MRREALSNIGAEPCVDLLGVSNALQDVDVIQSVALLRAMRFGGQPRLNLAAGLPAEALAKAGGAEGDRTPDLRNAIATLSQLSYGPVPDALGELSPAGKGEIVRPASKS